jgi:hypothetical protein
LIAAVLILLAAICKATADTLAHHFDTSIFKNLDPQFWNPNIITKTMPQIFGYPLDAWHLLNSGMIVFFIAAIPFHKKDKWQAAWYWEILIGGLLFNLVFNLFYNSILR